MPPAATLCVCGVGAATVNGADDVEVTFIDAILDRTVFAGFDESVA